MKKDNEKKNNNTFLKIFIRDISTRDLETINFIIVKKLKGQKMIDLFFKEKI